MQQHHVVRLDEGLYTPITSNGAQIKKKKKSPSIPRPVTSTPLKANDPLAAKPSFSHLITPSPGPSSASELALATTGGAISLPVPLLPFHRAFQTEGWRIAVNTPEDRFSGQHVVTSLFALLWLKSEQNVLNYSQDRHWTQKIRHMMQMRAAASLAGPNSRGLQAILPGYSEEAEFSLAHALHLPHTIIYTQDRSAEKSNEERLHLSDFPSHIWQRDSSQVTDPSDPTLAPFQDCPIHPSVWYFSRHAVLGQNEILRKNRPENKQEHLDMLRKVFLKERSTSSSNRPTTAATTSPGEKKLIRPSSAKLTQPSPLKSRPSTANPTSRLKPQPTHEQLPERYHSLTRPVPKMEEIPPPASAMSGWGSITPAQLARDSRVAQTAPALAHAVLERVDVVARYMSLDRKRGTHVAFLQRRDLEEFIRNATGDASPSSTNISTTNPSTRPSSAAITGGRSRPSSASQLTPHQRKDRLRQALYDNLYNEMDILPPTDALMTGHLDQQQLESSPEVSRSPSPPIVSVGIKPRPASSSRVRFDPFALHPSQTAQQAQQQSPQPSNGGFKERQLVCLLQEYIQPPGDHAEVLRVEWREEFLPAFQSKVRERRTKRRQIQALEKRLQARRERRVKRNILESSSEEDHHQDELDEEEDNEDEEAEETELERLVEEVACMKEELNEMDEKRTICFISRRLNANPMRALPPAANDTNNTSLSSLDQDGRDPSLYERVCCFGYSDSSPPVIDSTVMNGVLFTRLSYVCDILAQHIASISHTNLQPHQMSLFFQIDQQHDLHLLWCDKLIYWHEKAVIEGPEHPMAKFDQEEEKQQQSEDTNNHTHEDEGGHQDQHYALEVTPSLPPPSNYDWSTFDFANFPAPSPMSALMSEALQGRYHKLLTIGDEPNKIAALNIQSLKDDEESETSESEDGTGRRSGRSPDRSKSPQLTFNIPPLRPTSASASRNQHHRSRSARSDGSEFSVDSDEDNSAREFTVQLVDMNAPPTTGPISGRPSVSAHGRKPSMATLTETLNEVDEDDDATIDKKQPPQLSPQSSIADSEMDEEEEHEEQDKTKTATDGNDPLNTSLVPTTASLTVEVDAGVDEFSHLIPDPAPTTDQAKPEVQSEWANEVLFEFARKRQAERNFFRKQEEAWYEEREQKKSALFKTQTSPLPTAPTPLAGTASARAAAVSPIKRGKQGINLLELGANGAATLSPMLNTSNHRRDIASPAAFLLAKQQKMYGSGLTTYEAPGMRGFRRQLDAGVDLLPSSSKSGWERRGVAGARRERMKQEKIELMNYRQRQITLMAPPSEHQKAKDEQRQAELQKREAQMAEREVKKNQLDFQALVRAQFEENSKIKPLTASASLSALGVAVTSSNLRTLGASASTTSFAPPKPTVTVEDGQMDDDTAHATAGEDHTFLTSTPLSPRLLPAQARNPAPFNAASTQVVMKNDTVPQPSMIPANYFCCPRCRLNLQIHSVHSTMIIDILGEYGRMCQFMKTHKNSFQEEIDWNFKRKKTGKIEEAKTSESPAKKSKSSVLEEYFDLKYYKEDGIPPTIAFVFPNMSYESYLHYREDTSFLRSTIDLCEDCHLLVRVPLMAGTLDERQTTNPLHLYEGSSEFWNPNTEQRRGGEGHTSILARQSYRALDQEVEDRSFAAELAAQAYARKHRAPGEVDPHSAANGLVPLDIRRLNQGTMELLAQIPYNELEIAEFERKRAEEEAIADGTVKGKHSEHVAKVLEKYKHQRTDSTPGGVTSSTHGHINKDTPMTFARRKTQQKLLAAAGWVDPRDKDVTLRPMAQRPQSAISSSTNPFMNPRTPESQQRLTQQLSTKSLRGAENARQASRSQVQTARATHLDEPAAPLQPGAGMSRYDPNLVARIGGVITPAIQPDAALVQSLRRRVHTEDLINEIVSASQKARTSDNARDHSQPSGSAAGVTAGFEADSTKDPIQRFHTKFGHRSVAANAFQPIYQQLTQPKRVSKPIDHIALEMEAQARARENGQFRVVQKKSTGKSNQPGGVGVASPLRPSTSPIRVPPSASVPFGALKLHATPSSLSMSTSHAALQDLAMPYAVQTPSPYTPHIISVAHTRGHIQPTDNITTPTM